MSIRIPLVLLTFAAVVISAVPASAATKKPIYVSLGDSLAWSYTKTADGTPAQSIKGYSELLAAKARTNKRYGKKLTLKKFGCPGESTISYLNNSAAARIGGRDCGFVKSQHADSLDYIRKNRKRLGFITINVGNNNFVPCAAGGGADLACVQRANEALDRDLPRIYRELRKAAGKNVPIATFTVYDPFVALYLRGGQYREFALLTVDLSRDISNRISQYGKKQKFKVADAFNAFKTSEVTKTTSFNGQTVPIAVATICAYTFICLPPPVGPDIHPNDAGYVALSTAAAKALKIR
jgi:lysophospholipase L1-like esterase